MTEAWIIFQIDNKNVYQIRYNGCTGLDEINSRKEMIAKEYKVSEDDIKIRFDDEILNTKTPSLVCSDLIEDSKKIIGAREKQN